MRKEILRWIKQADHDFEMAKKNFDIGGYDVSAFLCQQSLEKHLKALYVSAKGEAAPKTHYLEELGREVGCPENLMDSLREISADYMIARYPDVTVGAPYEEYTKDDVGEKIKKTEKIISWVKGKLK